MKKKTALIILLILTLIALSACGSSGGSSSSSSSAEPKQAEEPAPAPAPQYPTANVGDTEYELDKTNDHYGLSFRYSNDWSISGFNETMNLFHGSEEHPDFVITLIDYSGQKIADAIAALGGGQDILTKEINGISWTNFDIRVEQKTNSLYLTEKGNDLYMVVFQSDKGTSELQQVFMENASF